MQKYMQNMDNVTSFGHSQVPTYLPTLPTSIGEVLQRIGWPRLIRLVGENGAEACTVL